MPAGAGVWECLRWMWHWGHDLGVLMVGLDHPEGRLQP